MQECSLKSYTRDIRKFKYLAYKALIIVNNLIFMLEHVTSIEVL